MLLLSIYLKGDWCSSYYCCVFLIIWLFLLFRKCSFLAKLLAQSHSSKGRTLTPIFEADRYRNLLS